LIQQQQTIDLGQSFPEGRCEVCRWFREFLKRHIQRNLFVRRIGKSLDLLDTHRQRAERAMS